MANLWIAVDGFAECETRQKTVVTNDATGTGRIIIYRREVFVTVYERHSWQPNFSFGPMVSEVTLLGEEDTERVVTHSWRKSFITGKVVEYKEVHKPGKWKKAAVYDIEENEPEEES